jgi:hypothetical protein
MSAAVMPFEGLTAGREFGKIGIRFSIVRPRELFRYIELTALFRLAVAFLLLRSLVLAQSRHIVRFFHKVPTRTHELITCLFQIRPIQQGPLLSVLATFNDKIAESSMFIVVRALEPRKKRL